MRLIAIVSTVILTSYANGATANTVASLRALSENDRGGFIGYVLGITHVGVRTKVLCAPDAKIVVTPFTLADIAARALGTAGANDDGAVVVMRALHKYFGCQGALTMQ